MDDFQYFPEERLINTFILSLHRGKARLTCSIIEHWEEQLSHTAKCGEIYTETITDKFGVTSVERNDLETTITSSLGLKGIAEFKGEVKSKIGLELRLDESREVKREFKFSSPECGRWTILLYQLKRKYRMLYEDFRFFHKDKWTKTFTEWTNKIYNASKRSENDPDCGCNPKPSVGFDGLVHLTTNKFIMLLGYKQDGSDFIFPDLDMSVTANNLNEIMFQNFAISRKNIPAYMLFLTKERSRYINGRFTPYDEEQATSVLEENAKYEGGFRAQSSLAEPEEIITGESEFDPDLPESFNVLVRELQSLSLDVELIESTGLDSAEEKAEPSSARSIETDREE